MSDTAVLRARQHHLAALRPKAKGEIGHRMNEPLPYFHSVGKGRLTAVRPKKQPPYAIRSDERHKNLAVRQVRMRALPPPIAGTKSGPMGSQDSGQPGAKRQRPNGVDITPRLIFPGRHPASMPNLSDRMGSGRTW